jgi:hypothetical protein
MFETGTLGVPLSNSSRGTIEAVTDPSQPLRFSVIAALSELIDGR